MKRILLIVLATGSGLAANPIYQINFTGTMTGGFIKDFNLADNMLEQIADPTGLTITGSMTFDLGIAPGPVVTTSGGNLLTTIDGGGGPIFTTESFTIGAVTVPDGFLPMPATTFALTPVPMLPTGTTLTQLADAQKLVFSSVIGGTGEAVIPGMSLNYSWTGPQLNGTSLVAMNLLISSLQQFYPPTGAIPNNWGPVTTGVNGLFTLASSMQNVGISDPKQHFGFITDWKFNGNFAITSPIGGFVTPEPGTLVLTVTALLILGSAGIGLRWRK